MTIALRPAAATGRRLSLRKTVQLKAATLTDNGRFSGYGAIFGNVDDGGDEIQAGAFTDALPDFLKAGFIADNHDWNTPVAMPINARQDATGLWLEAQFHSTTDAQRVRTIMRERLDAGMSVGLSIGYGDITFKRLSDRRLITGIDRLYEVSVVSVPMNQLAGVTEAKDGRGARRPDPELIEYVGVPAAWVDPYRKALAERAWLVGASALSLHPVPMALHWFGSTSGRLGAEAKTFGHASERHAPIKGYVLTGQSRSDMWINADHQDAEDLVLTVLHETWHLTEAKGVNDEAAANAFARRLLQDIGGIRRLL